MDEHPEPSRIRTLVERIYMQSATPADIDEFKELIEERKREGHNDGLAQWYFNGVPAEPTPTSPVMNTNISVNLPVVAPLVHPSNPQPKKRAYQTPYGAALSNEQFSASTQVSPLTAL